MRSNNEGNVRLCYDLSEDLCKSISYLRRQSSNNDVYSLCRTLIRIIALLRFNTGCCVLVRCGFV